MEIIIFFRFGRRVKR